MRVLELIGVKNALFINNQSDIFYVTGFTGDDSYLLIIRDKVYFFTDGRYIEQVNNETQIELTIIEIESRLKFLNIFSSLIKDLKITNLLCSKKDITLDFYENLKESLGNYEILIKNSTIINDLRMVKDAYEIEIIKQNLMITELGYHYILRLIDAGMKEIEISAELEYFLKKRGADKPSFDTIVSSGYRSSLPHGTAGKKTVLENEIIMLDFGIIKDGYCSDFTRCYYFGKIIDSKIREIHSVVLEALKTAEELIKPGVKASEIHKSAYNVIDKAGYSKYFLHSTGHGVGIEIHEQPAITASNEMEVTAGMVFTIEPGIYLAGIGGIRLEDMVMVGKDGCEVLTNSNYEL